MKLNRRLEDVAGAVVSATLIAAVVVGWVGQTLWNRIKR